MSADGAALRITAPDAGTDLDPHFVFEPLTEHSFDETVALYKRVFATREPQSVRLQLTASDWDTIFQTSFFQTLRTENFAMIARDAARGVVVGVRLAGDMYHSTRPHVMKSFESVVLRCLDRFPVSSKLVDRVYPHSMRLAAYAAIEEQLTQAWLTRHRPADADPYRPRQVLKMLGIAVDPEYQGRRLGERLIQLTHERAMQAGFRYSVVNCTNAISQHVFEKLGYCRRDQIDYDSFEFGGARPYQGLQDHSKSRREHSDVLYDFRFPAR